VRFKRTARVRAFIEMMRCGVGLSVIIKRCRRRPNGRQQNDALLLQMRKFPPDPIVRAREPTLIEAKRRHLMKLHAFTLLAADADLRVAVTNLKRRFPGADVYAVLSAVFSDLRIATSLLRSQAQMQPALTVRAEPTGAGVVPLRG
jgi:hypothetical protein